VLLRARDVDAMSAGEEKRWWCWTRLCDDANMMMMFFLWRRVSFFFAIFLSVCGRKDREREREKTQKGTKEEERERLERLIEAH